MYLRLTHCPPPPPAGAKGDTPGFSPSGPLVKALLLVGASAMSGNSEAKLPLEEPPSFRWVEVVVLG